MTFILSYFASFLALGALFWLSGAAVAAFLPAPVRRREPVVLPFVLGLSSWIVVLFLFASLGILTPRSIFTAGLAALVLGAWRLRGLGQPAATAEVASPGERWARLALGILIGVVLAGLFFEALRPNVSWDANVYHLTLPRLFLEAGGFRPVPYNVYSHWPLNVQLLFALAMTLRDYILAKLLHFGFAILVTVASYRLAAPGACRWAGCIAAGLFLANPTVLFEARIAYVDLAAAFFLTAAALFLDRASGAVEGRRTHLILCGVCCGILAGIKLNGFFGLVAVVVVHVVEARQQGPRRIARELALLVLPACILALPWLLKTWLMTGNPVYPLLYSWLGGGEWSAELGRLHGAWQSSIGMGRSPLDYLLLPLRVILFGGYGYHRFDGQIYPGWIVLLPLAVGALGRGDATLRRALTLALVYFVLWAATSQQMRFLIPILPLLAVAAGRALVFWRSRLPTRARPYLTVAATLLTATALLHTSQIYLRQSPRLLRDFFQHGSALKAAVIHPVYPIIERQLAAEAKILLLNHNHRFFLHREAIADSFFEASQIAELTRRGSPTAVHETLRSIGVTHLLVEHRERGIPYPEELRQMAHDPALATLAYRSPDGRFSLLELKE